MAVLGGGCRLGSGGPSEGEERYESESRLVKQVRCFGCRFHVLAWIGTCRSRLQVPSTVSIPIRLRCAPSLARRRCGGSSPTLYRPDVVRHGSNFPVRYRAGSVLS